MLMQDELSSTSVSSQASSETGYKMPDFTGKNAGDASTTLRQNLAHVIPLGTGSKVKKTSVKAGSNVKSGRQVLILTDKFQELPDMYGWTKANVKIFADWMGIKVSFKGSESGTVTQQNIDSGSKLKNVKKLTITLGD